MLFGKTIVITGVSSGIGARTAELAAHLGADVIGVDIREPAAPMSAFVQCDLSSPQSIAELADTLPKRFDALCNVAGLSGLVGAAKTLAVNFYGCARSTRRSRRASARAARSSMSPRSPAMAGA